MDSNAAPWIRAGLWIGEKQHQLHADQFIRLCTSCMCVSMYVLPGDTDTLEQSHVCSGYFQKGLESFTTKRLRQEGQEAGGVEGVRSCVWPCACGWQLLASLCQGPASAQWGDLGTQAPGLLTPNVAAQPGSAHPNLCPQDVCPGARGGWAWCPGPGCGITPTCLSPLALWLPSPL